MSDPFQDASPSPTPSEIIRQRKLDDFTTQKLSNYVTEDSEVEGREIVKSPVQPTQPTHPPKRTRKPKDTAEVTKTKPSKGKTPVKPATATTQTPVRKSTRENAGKKRQFPESSFSSVNAGKKRKVQESSSADVNAGKKRKFQESSSADVEDASPSPLAKKSKTLKALNVSRIPATASSATANRLKSSVKSDKKAAPVFKSNAGRAPVTKTHASSSTPLAGPSKKRARTPEDDDTEYDSGSSSNPPPKGKKRQKKNVREEMFKTFEHDAQASGMGFSTEAPECAELEVPWKCAMRTCKTGQTWCKRGDGTAKSNGYGRKACSHWFGRNKKETNYIHDDVWHYYCRKCYQRQGYEAKSSKQSTVSNATVRKHVENVRMQIVRLQLWRPEMVFKIQLLKSAKDRLAEYHKALMRPGNTEEDAIDAVQFVPGKTAKGKDKKPTNEYTFPIKSIEHFDYTFVGQGKTYDDLIEICDWVEELNEAGDAPCDPPVEFLPSAEAEGETIIDPLGPPDNYDRWANYCDAQALGSDDETENAEADDAEETDNAEEADNAGQNDDTEGANEDSGEETEDEDKEEDTPPPARKAPLKSSSFLKTTELGRELGFAGNVGIFPGSGIRAEREASRHENEAKSDTSEDKEIKVESDD